VPRIVTTIMALVRNHRRQRIRTISKRKASMKRGESGEREHGKDSSECQLKDLITSSCRVTFFKRYRNRCAEKYVVGRQERSKNSLRDN